MMGLLSVPLEKWHRENRKVNGKGSGATFPVLFFPGLRLLILDAILFENLPFDRAPKGFPKGGIEGSVRHGSMRRQTRDITSQESGRGE